VANIKLYLDEDVEVFLADAVRRRGYEATTTRDCGNLGIADLAQIDFARGLQQPHHSIATYLLGRLSQLLESTSTRASVDNPGR
jgi:hypothetical protein